MRKLLALLLLAAASVARAAVPTPPEFRLGDAATPVSYDARLEIDPGEPIFAAEMRIELRFNRSTPILWLNASRLEIDSAEFRQAGRQVGVAVVRGGEDFVGFAPAGAPFAPGEASATIRYRGAIDPLATRGLFRQQEGGDWYVVSQFEAMSARRAFPCFDEPGWKTPWSLTIDAPAGNAVASNTPEVLAFDLPDRPGWKRHAFAATKPLPTYLVAMAVGPFDVVDGGTAGARATPLRYFAPKGRGAQMRYVKETTPRLIEILEDYFGSPYPFEKLDTVTIPATVNFGAMENAGMITYASSLVLATPHEETTTFRRRYAAVGAHEIAHQWFGNLVTLAWWDDAWLNEAFATWMGRKVLYRFQPEWDSGWQAGERRRRALQADRLDSARRVHNPVTVKNDVYGAFDRITYDKGAEVLSMFEGWLGPERFRQGVRDYLGRHAWGSATSLDFVRALGEASGRRESAIAAFTAFIEQPGVPLIDVALRCQGKGAAIEVAQRRLRPEGSTAVEAQWTTPACFRYRADGALRTQCEEIGNERRTIALAALATCPEWVMGNALGAGHYATRYSATLQRWIAERIVDLPEAEAVALAGDTTLLALAGLVPRDEALPLVRAFLRHGSYGVREGGVVALGKLRDELLSAPQLRMKREIVAGSIQPMARELGWTARKDDRDAVRELRVALMPFAARSEGGERLRPEAREQALRWIADREAIDAMMVPPVLDTAARFADEATWAKLVGALDATKDRRQRSELLKALAKARDPKLRARTRELVMGKGIDGREAYLFLEETLMDDFNRLSAFDWVRESFDALVAKLPAETPANIPTYLGDLCTAKDRAAFVDFFERRSGKFLGGPLRYEQALEGIDLCIAAVKK
ncbi:MAG: M1 family metallopeptidase [Usitatibacter sp.]